MVLMSIQLFIVCAYIVLLFAISLFAKKRADKGASEYLFAGRKLGAGLIAVNITGLAVGAASTVGVAENAFSVGLAAGWYNAAWSAGALIMGLIAAGKYRALKATTIPDLFERYYDTKGRVVSAIGLLIIMLVITSLQYLAGGAILSALLPDIFSFKGGMLTSAVVFIGITLIGGLWSSGLSNIVSVILIYAGVLYSTYAAVDKVGGMTVLLSQLPAGKDWLNPFAGLPMAIVIGWFVVMITQAITAQGPVQIACGAKDSASARKGFIWGAALIFPIGFLCALIGIVARVTSPNITATMALPSVIMGLDPFASGITLAAMWAADISTACTILLGAGTLFSQDIYKRFINPKCSDAKQLTMMRLCIVISGVLTLGMAMGVSSILGTIMIGLSLTAAFSVIVIVALFFPQYSCKAAGFWTLLVGFIMLVLWQFVPAVRIFPNVIYMEWFACILTYAVVAVLQPGKKLAADTAE